MRTTLIIWLFFLTMSVSHGQDVLQSYIDTALQNNLALQKKQIDYRQQVAVLQEAKARFLPTLSIQARLSAAREGRVISIPVGDLVNPVYGNLNTLNQFGAMLSDNYPEIPPYPNISNVEENFLRRQEQETVVRLQAPVYNPTVFANRRLQGKLTQAEAVSVNAYRRELVKEVKLAYYSYLQALEGVVLYENTRQLLKENVRTTESLYENHQVTLDEVYAAQARQRQVEQQLAVARQQENSARAYFNFLLNRPLEAEVEVAAREDLPTSVIALEQAKRQAMLGKEELQQLDFAQQATEESVRLRKAAFLPSINLQADYGVQGVDYNLDDDSDFFLGSLVLSWTLFDRSARQRVEQATLDLQRLQRQQEEVEGQLQLQVIDAWYALQAAREQYQQAQAEVEAASRAFRLVDKKYRQGQANQLELSDARTNMTNAENRSIIARYGIHMRVAELEYATAGYTL